MPDQTDTTTVNPDPTGEPETESEPRPLVEATTLNTGEADGDAKSIVASHRVDLPPYRRYVVLEGGAFDELIEMRRIVALLADAPTARGAELRDVQRLARRSLDSTVDRTEDEAAAR
jgi:hypothetical protein